MYKMAAIWQGISSCIGWLKIQMELGASLNEMRMRAINPVSNCQFRLKYNALTLGAMLAGGVGSLGTRMSCHVNNPFSYLRSGLIFSLTYVESRCENEGGGGLRHSCMVNVLESYRGLF